MKVFIEEQRFTQAWLHILLVVSFIVPLILTVIEVIEKGWDDPDSRIGFTVFIISIFFIYGLLFSLKLKTRIDEQGISYRFLPFHFSNRQLSWKEIEDAYVRKYDPITEYGGWGIKGGKLWNKSKGIAYNVKGDIGIQLILKNNKKILIGTQKEQEAQKVLLTYLKNKDDALM